MSKEDIYKDKDYRYYSGTRWDIIDLIPEGPNRVLEVGCGTGNTLLKLKEIHKAQEIYGFELNKDIVQDHLREINRVIIGDVEQIDPPFQDEFFDFIIFGDVLEHLIEPEKILKKYMKFLKSDGTIIASIPNIKNYTVLFNLVILDKFEYRNKGILDRSHLRFFTGKEIKKMFNRSGMYINEMRTNFGFPLNVINKGLNNFISKHRIPGYSFLTVQYLVCAKKGVRD